jgi:hypothetical protein
MLKTSFAGLTVLLLAASAHAEGGTAPAVTPVPSATAPAPAAVGATPSPAGAERVPPQFMDRFLTYDDDAGGVVQGRARWPLSREDLYAALDRPDLLEKSREIARRRVILGVAGGGVALAGVFTAVVARAAMPDMNHDTCTGNGAGFKLCQSDAQRLDIVAAAGLIAGFSLGSLLGSLAYAQNPDVLSKDETSALISQHNGALLKRLRSDRSEVRVAPYASARGGGLTTVVAF